LTVPGVSTKLKAFLLVLVLLHTVVAHAQAEQPRLLIDAGGHTDKIKKVMFTHDGRHLVSAGYDKVVRVWDTQEGKIERTIRGEIGDGPVGMIYAAALSPNDRYLAVGGWLPPAPQASPIRLHDFPTGKVVALLEGHKSVILDLAFSPDGRRLASASADKTVIIWDTEKRSAIHHLQGHKEPVRAVAFSTDGNRLISGSEDHTVRLWDAGRGMLMQMLEGHEDVVTAVAFSPDGHYIASGSNDKTVRLWDAKTGAFLKVLGLQESGITSLSFSHDGQHLLTCADWGSGYVCTLFSVPSGKVATVRRHNNIVLATAISPDGKTAATAGGDNDEIYLWSTVTGQLIHKLAGQGQIVWSVGFARDGRSIAYGNQFDLNSPGHLLGPLQRVIFLDQDVDLTPGSKLREADQQAYSRALDRQGDYELRTRDGPNGYQSVLQVIRAGRVLYEIPRDSTSGSRHFSYTLTHNTQYIVSGGSGGVLVLYRADTGEVVRRFVGHTGEVLAVAVSPDDRTLVSGSNDRTVRLWDMESGKNLLSFFVSADEEWIAWTPEGYYKSSLHGDKYIGWYLNQGLDKAAEYYTAERFQKTFYQPAVVVNYLRTRGNIQLALEQASRKLDKKIEPPPEITSIHPPMVVLESPAAGSVVQDNTLQVKAKVTLYNTLLTKVQVLLNGTLRLTVPLSTPGGSNPPFNQTIKREIDLKEGDLKEGENDLVVVASHDKAKSEPELRKIIYHLPKPPELPNLILLAVGISEYQDKDLHLNYAASDASEVERIFKSQQGGLFREVKAKVLSDKQATRIKIIEGINWLEREGTPQKDILILFLSGHGTLDNKDNYYFLPADHQPGGPPNVDGIGKAELYEPLLHIPNKVILILDTCRAGAVAGGTRKGIVDITQITKELRELSDYSGLIIFTASTGREISVEKPEWGHGALTEALLEGLSGKAKSSNNTINTQELGSWVINRVKELTGGEQHATYSSSGGLPSFPLFVLR
jgi:WD40 repeat protein